MTHLEVAVVVAALVLAVAASEVISALLPLLVVVTLVPASERQGLAEVLAAVDSSRRLRLWRALRLAVVARRRLLARDQIR